MAGSVKLEETLAHCYLNKFNQLNRLLFKTNFCEIQFAYSPLVALMLQFGKYGTLSYFACNLHHHIKGFVLSSKYSVLSSIILYYKTIKVVMKMLYGISVVKFLVVWINRGQDFFLITYIFNSLKHEVNVYNEDSCLLGSCGM
jgi:hypothetical protein